MNKTNKSNTQATKVGSYPHTSVVLSIATAIFMIGIFALLIIHADRLTALLREKIEIFVYLDKNVSPSQQDYIKHKLVSLPFIQNPKDSAVVRFVSKEQAAQETIAKTGEDFVKFLGENPLRDAFVIKIKDSYFHNEKLKLIKTQLESIEGVFEVDYQQNFVEQINSNVSRVGAIILVFILILLATVVLMINSAIKLALYSQRFLIRSMQLVGAMPSFIKKPFVIRAALQGFVGSLLACSGLLFSLTYLNLQIEDLSILQDLTTLIILFVSLVFVGVLVGVLSAYFAITRYLKMSLDDLY